MSDQASGEEPDTVVGTVLGERYRVERKLGEGGMGSVYVGTHLGIGKEVAIKCLNPHMAANKSIVERFRREARAATAAGNEHIVDVTDMGELPDGAPFIVMELMKGQELAELLEAVGPLPTGRAVRIMLQICDALAAAHAKGIVHRDMKPENVFLIERKRDPDFVKVLDFGIARFNEPAAIGGGKNLTATGMTMGTPHYMSSEQAQGLAGLDHRTDIYALGVILYEMLAGETPFNAATFPLLVIQIATAEPPLLRDRRPDVPIDLEALIMRCLNKDLTVRVQTVDELARGLERYADIDTPPEVKERMGELATVRPPRNAAGPAARSATAAATAAALPSAVGAEAGSPTELERGIKRPSRLPWAMLAVGVVLASAGAAVWAMPGPSPEGEASGAADEPSLESDAAVAPPPRPTTPTPPPDAADAAEVEAEVRLQILAAPDDARIYLGGVEFPNPLDARRPRSLEPIQLRIERDGYVTVEEPLVLDEDRQLIRNLERSHGSGSRRPPGMTAAMNTGTNPMAPVPMNTGPTMAVPTMENDFRDDF